MYNAAKIISIFLTQEAGAFRNRNRKNHVQNLKKYVLYIFTENICSTCSLMQVVVFCRNVLILQNNDFDGSIIPWAIVPCMNEKMLLMESARTDFHEIIQGWNIHFCFWKVLIDRLLILKMYLTKKRLPSKKILLKHEATISRN